MLSHVLDMGCLQTQSARFRHVRFGFNSQEIAHGSIELQECGFLTVGGTSIPPFLVCSANFAARTGQTMCAECPKGLSEG